MAWGNVLKIAPALIVLLIAPGCGQPDYGTASQPCTKSAECETRLCADFSGTGQGGICAVKVCQKDEPNCPHGTYCYEVFDGLSIAYGCFEVDKQPQIVQQHCSIANDCKPSCCLTNMNCSEMCTQVLECVQGSCIIIPQSTPFAR